MKTKYAPLVDLNQLVREAKEHRRASGNLKYRVNEEKMATLLLHRDTEVVSHRIQEGGTCYLEVVFRGEHFITVTKTPTHL